MATIPTAPCTAWPASALLTAVPTSNRMLMQAAVIVAHTAIGPQDEFIQKTIMQLAQAGYVAFALDMFGEPDIVTGEAKEKANAPFKERRELIADRALAALRVVQDMQDVDANRIAAIGYCFGGKTVLDMARVGGALKGVVSFHGVLDRLHASRGEREVSARVLVFHGYADPYTSPASLADFIQEMEESGVQYEVRVFGSNVLHGFTRPEKATEQDAKMGHQFSEWVASSSWQAALGLLHDVLSA